MLLTSRRTLVNRVINLNSKRHPTAHSARPFVLTASSQDSISLPSSDATTPITRKDEKASTKDVYISRVRQQKYKVLLGTLNETNADPDLTWTCYVDFLDFTRGEPLPLELHQQVLRKCTPEPRVMRKTLVRKLAAGRRVTDNPHRCEGRFLSVINNIRRLGCVPTLEDYEFILRQFASVGHHVGAAQVLQEIIKTGLEPRTRTYGLCLQAIAYRLTLPCRKKDEEKFREQSSHLCLHIASLIRKRKKRVSSACLDLILRIMKDTDNPKVFTSLMKLAYGIDLDYLDRHPISSHDGVTAAGRDGGFGEPEPFSTAAFTTLIDFLGRQNQVSKMISAFEVLSNPLRINSSSDRSRNFDDEDEDDSFPIIPSGVQDRPLPSAQPNATTINSLIKHCALRRKIILVKHYVLQALELDYSTSFRLQSDIRTLPLDRIQPPRLRVNIDTFRPVLGVANRNHDLGLVKWLLPHFRQALRRKRQDLEYYTSILDHPDQEVPEPTYPRYSGGLLSEYGFRGRTSSRSSQPQDTTESSPPEDRSESSVTFFTPSHTTSPSFDDQPPPSRLDDSLEPIPPSPSSHPFNNPPTNQFNLAIHIQVLEQDIQAMRQLDNRVGSSLARLHIRRKEALGRRVWAGKMIFLRDVGKRVLVSRETWMEMVNFGGKKPRRLDVEEKDGSEGSEALVAP